MSDVGSAAVNAMPDNMELVNAYRRFFNDDFPGWIDKNWHIYEAFEKQALLLIERGRKHYSARTIIEVLVHHSILAEKPGGGFKIRNDVAPDLARLFTVRHPQHVAFWEYRRPDRREFMDEVTRRQGATAPACGSQP